MKTIMNLKIGSVIKAQLKEKNLSLRDLSGQVNENLPAGQYNGWHCFGSQVNTSCLMCRKLRS